VAAPLIKNESILVQMEYFNMVLCHSKCENPLLSTMSLSVRNSTSNLESSSLLRFGCEKDNHHQVQNKFSGAMS